MALAPALWAQNPPDRDPGPALELPKDPRAVFALAAPLYDLNDAKLKPWHLKASYQLYDEKGKPGKQGTYEYWWVSPGVNRSTWTRPGASHTDWHTADGKHVYQGSGETISMFEYQLQSALLSPLPAESELDPAKFRLTRESVSLGKTKAPCIMVIPLMPQHGKLQEVPLGLFPTYCFDSKLPILRASYSFAAFTTGFNKIVKLQNRYLAEEIEVLEGSRKILTANVDSVAGLSSTDPVLTPPADAQVEKKGGVVDLAPAVTVGMLLKKVPPVYPDDAKSARITGTVVLRATIGMDGAVHDLRVVEAPWPSLAASSLWSVSHWLYKPYLLNGEPVEVETTINVIFAMSQ